jgi:hypothetical protein
MAIKFGNNADNDLFGTFAGDGINVAGKINFIASDFVL